MTTESPKVFISYSHDSAAHRDRVRAFANRLRDEGIDCRIDLEHEDEPPAQGWERWMLDSLDWAEFVLVICTETYYQRFRGHAPPGTGKGVKWEGAMITQELYDNELRNLKYIPALFEETHKTHIPEPLRLTDFYLATTDAGYEKLYRRMTRQKRNEPQPLGQIRKLPPDPAPSEFVTKPSSPQEAVSKQLPQISGNQTGDRNASIIGDRNIVLTDIKDSNVTITIHPVPKDKDQRILEESNNLFKGRVEVLTEQRLSTQANDKRIQQYYAGAPLHWDILTANGDIPRDQQQEIVQSLLQPAEGLRLCCLVAEPGAGKSTLAWRAALELHRHHQAFVIRIKDTDEPDCWYQLEEFYQRVNQPLYVLADDLFRSPDVVSALSELSPSLPITIIATSRRNEFRPPRFKGELTRIDLYLPSEVEKNRVLGLFGKSRAALTIEQQRRFDSSTQFIVLMMELTAGKELRDIIRDTVERLKVRDEVVCQAYEYLCFTNKYLAAMPETVLDRLDGQGRFYNLPERATAQGLIFFDDDRKGHLRAGHPVIAQTAADIFAKQRSPLAVLREIISAIDPLNDQGRRFALFLLRKKALAEPIAVQSILPQITSNIAEYKQHATIPELSVWSSFYVALGNNEAAEQCNTDALMRIPMSTADCNGLFSLYRQRGQEKALLPVLREFIQKNSDAGHVRVLMLGLIERYETKAEIEAAITEISAWLAQNLQDISVRRTYLGLVERKGTDDQVARVVTETSAWLAQNLQDTNVRRTYLGLVERKGTDDQVARVVTETSAWLAQNPQDNYVRRTYLGLVERKGTDDQVARVVTETKEWLAQNPQNANVRRTYLGLVERKGTDDQVAQVVAETSAWLAQNLQDNYVRTAYLGLVERKGTDDQVAQVVAETSAWLAQNLQDISVREAYLGLVERKGTPAQVAQVVTETSAWLAQNLQDTNVRTAYLGLVERKGTADQVAQVVTETSAWLAQNPRDSNVREAYLGLVERKGTADQVAQVVAETSAWLAQNPQDSNVRAAYLGLVERKGTADQVARVVTETKEWLAHNYAAKGVWMALIALLIRTDMLDEATAIAQQAISLHPNFDGIATNFLRLFGNVANKEIVREMYKNLISAYPKNPNIALGYANWLGNHNYPAEAEAIYDSLLKKFPRYYRINYDYGRLLLELGKLVEAQTRFQAAIQIYGGSERAYDGLAQTLFEFGKQAMQAGKSQESRRFFSDAERAYRKAIYWAQVHNQSQKFIYNHLGWFYLERQHYTAAIEAFEIAMNEDLEFFGNYWGIGRAKLEQGYFAEALNYLQIAMEKIPEDCEPPASEEIPALIQRCEHALAG